MRQGASKGPSRPAVLAWGLWALVPLSILVLVWLDQLLRRAGRPDLALLGSSDIPAFVLGMLSAATVGALLAGRRPAHPVGWLLLAMGLSLAVAGPATGYADYGALARPDALPGAGYAALYHGVDVLLLAACLGFVLLLTPTGSLPSPRWHWWARVAAAAPLLAVVSTALLPFDLPYQSVANPLAVPALAAPAAGRQQRDLAGHHDHDPGRGRVAGGALPARPRDRAPAVALAGLGGGAGLTLAAAGVFQPARRRLQQAMDRRCYDAANTIAAFSARLRQQIDLDTLTAELLAVVDQTMQPTRASLWLAPGTRGREP